jgi:hypothetical protein
MEKPVESWKKACLNEIKSKVMFRTGSNGVLKPNPENQIMQNLIKGEGEIGGRGDHTVMVKHRVEIDFIKEALDKKLKYQINYDDVDMKLVRTSNGDMIEFTHTWKCTDSTVADALQQDLSKNISSGVVQPLISENGQGKLVDKIKILRKEICSSLNDGFQNTEIDLNNISREIDFNMVERDEGKGDDDVKEYFNNEDEDQDSNFLSNLFSFGTLSPASNPRYGTPTIKKTKKKSEISSIKKTINGDNKHLALLKGKIAKTQARNRKNHHKCVDTLKETIDEFIGNKKRDIKFISYVKSRPTKDNIENVKAVSEQMKSLLLQCLDIKNLNKIEQWIKSHKIDNYDTAKEKSIWDIGWGSMEDEDEYINYTLKDMFEAIRAIFGKEMGEITEYTNLIKFHMETYNATDIMEYIELLISIQVKILENNGKQTFTMNELIALRVGCALWKCQSHVDSDSHKHTKVEKQYSSESYVKLRKEIFLSLNDGKTIQPSKIQEKIVAIHETERVIGSMLNVPSNLSKGNDARIAGVSMSNTKAFDDFVKGNRLCFSFAKGSCNRGSSCKFKHDQALKLEASKLKGNNNSNNKGNNRNNNNKNIPKKGDPGWIPDKIFNWKVKKDDKFKTCKKCDKCVGLHKEWDREEWNGWNSLIFNNCPGHTAKEHERIMNASNDSLNKDDLNIRNFITNKG